MNKRTKNNNNNKVVTLLPSNYSYYKRLFDCLMDELSPFGEFRFNLMCDVNYVNAELSVSNPPCACMLADNQIHTIDAFCRRNDFEYFLRWSTCFGFIFVVFKHYNV